MKKQQEAALLERYGSPLFISTKELGAKVWEINGTEGNKVIARPAGTQTRFSPVTPYRNGVYLILD